MTEIKTMAQLGPIIREHRKHLNLTQYEAANLCRVGTRFLSELENGKETLQMGKVLHILQMYGLNLKIEKRSFGHDV